jgi:hypothetical protein
MGLPTQMNDNERGVFALHGLVGFFIAVALLLSILGTLTVLSIGAQKNNATNYYEINQDLHAIKAGNVFAEGDQVDGSKNHTMWKNVSK